MNNLYSYSLSCTYHCARPPPPSEMIDPHITRHFHLSYNHVVSCIVPFGFPAAPHIPELFQAVCNHLVAIVVGKIQHLLLGRDPLLQCLFPSAAILTNQQAVSNWTLSFIPHSNYYLLPILYLKRDIELFNFSLKTRRTVS